MLMTSDQSVQGGAIICGQNGRQGALAEMSGLITSRLSNVEMTFLRDQ